MRALHGVPKDLKAPRWSINFELSRIFRRNRQNAKSRFAILVVKGSTTWQIVRAYAKFTAAAFAKSAQLEQSRKLKSFSVKRALGRPFGSFEIRLLAGMFDFLTC